MTEIKPSIQHDKINKKFFMVFENGGFSFLIQK